MVWARLDDEILDNKKIAMAGVYGFALHVAAITWCCRNLSDGFIPTPRVRSLLEMSRVSVDQANPFALLSGPRSMSGKEGLDPVEVAEHLVECGLWERVTGGYAIHDFLVYNPSKEHVLSQRASASERQQKRREKRAGRKRASVTAIVTRESRVNSSLPVPDPVPDPQRGESAPPGLPLSTSKNATWDRCGGLAVTAFKSGVESVTDRRFTLPYGASAEMGKLVTAMVEHEPDDTKRVEWAQEAGAGWARSLPQKWNVHDFVDWLNGDRKRPSGVRRVDTDAGPSEAELAEADQKKRKEASGG